MSAAAIVHPRRAGFTLIEVLIAVVILAIGLLALGSVIPVVVRQQRLAADASTGVAATENAKRLLLQRSDFNRLKNGNDDAGWGVWLNDPDWSLTPDANRYSWMPFTTDEFDKANGLFLLKTTNGINKEAQLTVLDRLWPSPSAEGAVPQFVWDVMARRLPPAPGQAQRLQIALFVRRIDLNIRVPSGATLLDVLAGKTPPPLLLPVAVDSKGIPTRDGVGDYATPVRLTASFNDAKERDRLEISGGTAEIRGLARQIGQRLVDNLGNVYTVIGTSETNEDVLLIEPSIPGWVPAKGSTNEDHEIRHVIFTPQIPAAISVFDITPLDPL